MCTGTIAAGNATLQTIARQEFLVVWIFIGNDDCKDVDENGEDEGEVDADDAGDIVKVIAVGDGGGIWTSRRQDTGCEQLKVKLSYQELAKRERKYFIRIY